MIRIAVAVLIFGITFFSNMLVFAQRSDTQGATASDKMVVKGIVLDRPSGQPIAGATVQVVDGRRATPTNDDGRFRLILERRPCRLRFSHVGHYSQEVTVTPSDSAISLEIVLESQVIDMGVRTAYTRAYDPAQKIIAAAIARKKEILSRFHDLTYDSYAKLVLRDAARKKSEDIFLIVESQTSSFWQQPDKYKEIITARRYSANLPDEAEVIMVVGELLDFNKNRLEIGEYSVVTPTASDAMEHYNYYLLDTLYSDDRAIFVLEMEPKNEYEPLLAGRIHIIDSTFEVVYVDGAFSRGLNLPMVHNARYFQQLAPVDGEHWLPVQIGFSAQVQFDIPFPGVPKRIDFEHVASIYSYQIDQGLPQDTFDEYEIEVDEKADDIDSAAWAARQTIPLTDEEQHGYERLDSIAHAPKPIAEQIIKGVLLAPLALYFGVEDFFHYNRVEGAYLGASHTFDRLRPDIRLKVKGGYAFEDKAWQYRFGLEKRLWERRRFWLGASLHDEIVRRPTIVSADIYNPTFDALMFKIDPLDYYRQKGYRFYASFKPAGQWRLETAYDDFDHFLKTKQTDYSFFADEEEPARSNPPAFEGHLRSLSAKLSFDTRKLIKSGRRELQGFSDRYTLLESGIEYASPDLIENDFDFRRYYLQFEGRYGVPHLGLLNLFGYLGSSDGKLPLQRWFVVDFNESYLYKIRGFSSTGERNFGGDRAAVIYSGVDFGDYMFRHSGISLLQKIPVGFSIHGGAMWTEFKREVTDSSLRTAQKAYTEIGFGLHNLTPFLQPYNLEAYFTWQLSAYDTHRFAFTFGIGF